MEASQNKRNKSTHNQTQTNNTPTHTPKTPSLQAELPFHCHAKTVSRSRPCPSHPSPAPRPTLLQPEESLVQLLHLAEVQQPRLLTARHGCGRPSGAPAAPGRSVRGGTGEPCREGTQTKPCGSEETPGRTRPLRSASRRRAPRLHVPRSRGSAETRHCRAGRRGGGYRTSCQAAPSPALAGDRRRQHPGAAPVPRRGPARSQSYGGAPGGGGA